MRTVIWQPMQNSLPGDKSPGDRTQQCTATASGVPSYHVKHYWVFITIITFLTHKDLVVKEVFFLISLLSQNISHQMKVFKNSSLHHVHSEQTTLFVTRTFSSILFRRGTKKSLTRLSSFAAGLIQFTWRTSDPSPPRSPPPLCFLYGTFQRTTPRSSNVNDAIMGMDSFRGCWLLIPLCDWTTDSTFSFSEVVQISVSYQLP